MSKQSGPLQFENRMMIREVVLVGCGGTGSQWASSLARIVYDMDARGLHAPHLTFIDPDRVEQKNVGRQMFTEGEVGRYKAEVLARRFNLSLGLDIDWFAEAFDENRHVPSGTLLLGAVDTHAARVEMAKVKYAVWIDAGNHRSAGQVVIGNTKDVGAIIDGIKKGVCYYLPNVALLFPAMLQPDPVEAEQPVATGASCADLVAAGQQHLLINTMMACVAAQYTYKVLHNEKIGSFVTYVDADSLSMRSVPITREDLAVYLS